MSSCHHYCRRPMAHLLCASVQGGDQRDQRDMGNHSTIWGNAVGIQNSRRMYGRSMFDGTNRSAWRFFYFEWMGFESDSHLHTDALGDFRTKEGQSCSKFWHLTDSIRTTNKRPKSNAAEDEAHTQHNNKIHPSICIQ